MLRHTLTGHSATPAQVWQPDAPHSDTPPGLKPHGFSVHCPSHRRDSPKALSEPLDISGRVLIAVHNQSAVCADMGAHAKAFLYALPAAPTFLPLLPRRPPFPPPPPPSSLVT